MASILSTTFSNIHGGHSTVVLGLSWAMGLAVVAAGILLILLLRTRATRRTAVAAHTASGQGSILVDRKGRVLETNELREICCGQTTMIEKTSCCRSRFAFSSTTAANSIIY